MAVSGGMDSVAMVEAFSQLGFEFGIAHCNFQLRGEESNGDEALVISLADKYKVPVYNVKFDTTVFAKQSNISIQVAARELRYEWFEKVKRWGRGVRVGCGARLSLVKIQMHH